MTPEFMKKAPKVFCENVKIGYTPEYLILGLGSGEDATMYALTPGHAKRLQQYLAHQVASYEEKHGEITAEWNPNIVSPVQRTTPPSDTSS